MPMPATELAARVEHGPLVLDGAMGTELHRRGADIAAPLWSARALLDAPQVVEQLHREYVAAGADILVANTFRTNPRMLGRAGLAARGAELTRLAVELARAAASDSGRDQQQGGPDAYPTIVAASVAPVEDCYHPEHVPPDDALRVEHGQMADWIAAAGADLVWIETMNTVREAQIAAMAAAARRLPFAVSWVLRESGDVLSGESLADAVRAVEPLDPLALGFNCIPPAQIGLILPRLAALTSRPLVVYGHIGNRVPIRGWTLAEDASPEAYATYAEGWIQAGARVVGGCCGTTPNHIAAIARRVKTERWRRPDPSPGPRPAAANG